MQLEMITQLQKAAAHYVFSGPSYNELLSIVDNVTNSGTYLEEFNPIIDLIARHNSAGDTIDENDHLAINTAFIAILEYFSIELPDICNATEIILQEYAYNILEAANRKKSTSQLIIEVDYLCSKLVSLIRDKLINLDEAQRTILKIEDNNFYRVCYDLYIDNIGHGSDKKDLEHLILVAANYYTNRPIL